MVVSDLARLCRDDYRGVVGPAWADVADYVAAGNDDVTLYYQRGRRLVVVCRGTEIPRGVLPFAREWFLNLLYRPRPWAGFAAVHEGLAFNVMELYEQIRQARATEQWERHGGDLVLTGHSRGGALALLLATILARQGHRPRHVVTFGAPRVGGVVWRDKYHALGILTTRYENQLDPVPMLPPFVFFRHVGDRVICAGWRRSHDIDDYVAGCG